MHFKARKSRKVNPTHEFTGLEDQFQEVATEQLVKTSEYDFNSIMHYGDTAFSKDGTSKTMVRKDGGQLEDVYKKVGLSDNDVKEINTAYRCR